MNSVILVGRLATDVEIKRGNDKKYGKFTLAVNRPLKKDEADFINCVVFGKTAETMFEYCRKGHRVGIAGRLQISQYEKNGEKRSSYSVIVDTLEFLQTKNEKSGNTTDMTSKEKEEGTSQKAEKTTFDTPEFEDDEFPF